MQRVEIDSASAGHGLARRTTTVCAVVSLFVVGFLLLFYAPSAVILTFAACWFGAVLFHAAAFTSRWTKLSQTWALALVVGLLLAALVGFFTLLGVQFAQQVSELVKNLQEAAGQLRERLAQYPQLERYLNGIQSPQEAMQAVGGGGWSVRSLLMTPFGMVVNVLFVFFTGLYLANDAGLYAGGLTRLAPADHRDALRRVLGESGEALWKWTLARLASMAIVALLSWIGLWWLGVPMATALAGLTGLLVFIPNLGPVLSVVPPMLLALPQGPMTPLWVLALYTGIELVESYLITPWIHQREDNLPAAVTIVAQLAFGVLFGILGVMFAMPIALVAMIFVRRFYIQEGLEGKDAATTSEPATAPA